MAIDLNHTKVDESKKQEDDEVRLEECAQNCPYFHIERNNSGPFDESFGSISSSDDYDSMDIPEPPNFGANSIKAYFSHPEWDSVFGNNKIPFSIFL